ncbi:MAG: hypothetical protein GKS06_04035 [Acidobacteria bacterium]|nr:hypothetical protein [Acidobacteriota bacterium]
MELLSLLILAGMAIGFAAWYGSRPTSSLPARLIVTAVLARIAGSILRYEMIERVYNGVADATGYHAKGVQLADQIWAGELSLFSAHYWTELYVGFGNRIWGTPFMIRLSGLAATFIGPSIRTEFLLFALIAFVGTLLIVKSAENSRPRCHPATTAAWIWLWPTVWFWSSSVGKEAVVILAIGLVMFGYVGRNGRIIPSAYLAGICLAALIRPHVGVVLLLSTAVAIWLAQKAAWDLRRVAEAVLILPLIAFVLPAAATQLGLDQLDAEGLAQLLERRLELTNQGGSSTGSSTSVGIANIPAAFVNVWVRPFPWDVHNVPAALAALESIALWWVVWSRKHEIAVALQNWRAHRALRLALPIIISYTIMIGLGFANLGLIARQRAPLMPLLLMVLFLVPERGSATVLTPARTRKRLGAAG